MPLSAGTRLGEYEIQVLLGAGGMGEVYRARDLRLRRDVAVKVIQPLAASDSERLRRFEQEATAAAALTHPNILSVYQMGTHEGAPYLVTELLEGETLREHVRRGRIAVRKAIDFGVQIARGLAAAHEKGIVHRDLKPENLFVTKEGRIKILDFGLAKLIQPVSDASNASPTIASATELGTVMGTAGYMAPEQVRGGAVDHRTDIFAFGAVLYEMLTGTRAFQKDTSAETMTAILREEPPSITQNGANVPIALQRVVQRCLEKNPEHRFHSASDLAFALEALTESGGMPVGAPPTAKTRRKTLLILAASALVVTAMAVAWSRFLPKQQVIHSIAVLPFSTADQDPASSDLSDGVTEALIDSISQLPDLRVMSRASAFRFHGNDVDPQQAGHTLKVDAVLTGRVSRLGDNLVVSTELVKVEDGSHLWGNRYNRSAAELLALQQEIAGDVSQRLQPKLSVEQKRKLGKLPTENPEAYQLYVKGRYYLDRWSPEERAKALEYFKQAIAKDPGFAEAYAGLAGTQILRGFFGDSGDPRELTNGMKTAQKALSLDDSLAEAHSSLGLALLLNLHWAEAEQEMRRAIELNPNCSICHTYYGAELTFTGRTEEALEEAKRAQAIDPLSFTALEIGGEAYYFARQYDEAISHYQAAIEVNPSNPQAYSDLTDAYLLKQECPEAVKALVRAEELLGHAQNAAALKKPLEESDCQGMVGKQFEFYSDPANPDYYPMSAGVTAAYLGKKDLAFKFIEKAYETRQGIVWLKVEPQLDNIRTDPRYAEMLKRIGLADGPSVAQ